MPRAPLLSRLNKTLAAVALLGALASPSGAAVTAGGLAIVGFTDNNDLFDDTFSLVTLETILAGTTIYFTDNGWNTADGKFRGADNINGDGPETMIMLTFNSDLAAGTLLRSGNDITEASWDYYSIIPGATNGDTFGFLGLSNNTGEQIYAFEASGNPPLPNASNHIYLLDFGDFNNPGFEDSIDAATGAIAPGLSIVSNTAVTLPDPNAGSDPNDFHNGSFALNMADADVVALNGVGGTKAQWLAIIANSGNWMKINYESNPTGDAEAQLQNLAIAGVPEPSRALLLMAGAGVVGLRRRRQA